jgi:hypothetical protein
MMRQQARIVVAALVVAVLLVVIGSTGIGNMPNGPLAGKAESPKTNASVGVGVLTAGVGSVILGAIITGVSAWNARKRELLGLLRLLYVEIETNRGETELLLFAPNPKVGLWTGTVYKDDTCKEVCSRLTQLMSNRDHFNQLVALYVRNDAQDRGIFRVIEMGSSFRNPDNVLAKLTAEKLEEQKGLAVDALDTIQGYIGDPPVGRELIEDAEREMERLQGELDAEKDRRGGEEQWTLVYLASVLMFATMARCWHAYVRVYAPKCVEQVFSEVRTEPVLCR